jgi:hypothetical protein
MASGNLCKKLLQLFAKGDLAGTTVWDIVDAAFRDGWGRSDPIARRIHSLGVRRSHIADGLMQVAEDFGLVSSSALPYSIPIATGGEALIYLPHEALPAMVAGTEIGRWCLPPEAFDEPRGLAAQLVTWAQSPDVQYTGELHQIPVVGMHCDGVQYNRSVRAGQTRSIIAGSYNFVSAREPVDSFKRQPFFLLRKARLNSNALADPTPLNIYWLPPCRRNERNIITCRSS